MIITETVKIEKTDDLTSGYVESKIKDPSINPLRWAIVGEDTDYWTVSVSYETYS